jgi:hypothetical protein
MGRVRNGNFLAHIQYRERDRIAHTTILSDQAFSLHCNRKGFVFGGECPIRLPAIIQPARLNYSQGRKKSRGRTAPTPAPQLFTVNINNQANFRPYHANQQTQRQQV